MYRNIPGTWNKTMKAKIGRLSAETPHLEDRLRKKIEAAMIHQNPYFKPLNESASGCRIELCSPHSPIRVASRQSSTRNDVVPLHACNRTAR